MRTQTHTQTYTRTHSIVFLSDNMRNTLREVIRENGLDPCYMMQEWSIIERGIQTWLESGHLNKIVIEFYNPKNYVLSARWDFPIRYIGSGVEDDMWLDKKYLRQLIAKSARPSSDCLYRILLFNDLGYPSVEGFTSCTSLSTNGLGVRAAGTVIATGHMTAEAQYWR